MRSFGDSSFCRPNIITMKLSLFAIVAALSLTACDTRVNVPPAENHTTVVNPPAEKKTETTTTTTTNGGGATTTKSTETKQ